MILRCVNLNLFVETNPTGIMLINIDRIVNFIIHVWKAEHLIIQHVNMVIDFLSNIRNVYLLNKWNVLLLAYTLRINLSCSRIFSSWFFRSSYSISEKSIRIHRLNFIFFSHRIGTGTSVCVCVCIQEQWLGQKNLQKKNNICTEISRQREKRFLNNAIKIMCHLMVLVDVDWSYVTNCLMVYVWNWLRPMMVEEEYRTWMFQQ